MTTEYICTLGGFGVTVPRTEEDADARSAREMMVSRVVHCKGVKKKGEEEAGLDSIFRLAKLVGQPEVIRFTDLGRKPPRSKTDDGNRPGQSNPPVAKFSRHTM